ncbi:MAG: choice-of-anchor Q domain-containing protein [Anaerolineae bacterium]
MDNVAVGVGKSIVGEGKGVGVAVEVAFGGCVRVAKGGGVASGVGVARLGVADAQAVTANTLHTLINTIANRLCRVMRGIILYSCSHNSNSAVHQARVPANGEQSFNELNHWSHQNFHRNHTLGITPGAHSLIGDPRFIDPNSDNYALRFGSAAIDYGTDAGISVDIDGISRPQGHGFDIGAYEYHLPIAYYFLSVIRK